MDYHFQHENGRWFTASSNLEFEIDSPFIGGFSFSPFPGSKITSIAAMPGEYPESMTISEIRRPHYSEDRAAASFEAVSSMPYGIPYKIQRDFRLTDSILKSDVTFLLPHSFALKNLMAGGLKFSGAIRTIAITEIAADSASLRCNSPVEFSVLDDHAELFKGEVPPIMIALTYENGRTVTFELGSEIWRWTNARNLGGGTAAFMLRRDGADLLFTWNLYTFRGTREMTEAPFGRNWSLSWSLVFGSDTDAEKCTEIIDINQLTKECACSSSADRILKKEFRRRLANAQDGERYVLLASVPRVCDNSSHMSRPKKSGLLHWELPALRDFVFWGNRQMSKRGAELLLKVSNEVQK